MDNQFQSRWTTVKFLNIIHFHFINLNYLHDMRLTLIFRATTSGKKLLCKIQNLASSSYTHLARSTVCLNVWRQRCHTLIFYCIPTKVDFSCCYLATGKPIQDFDTIVSSKISLEMESLKICKESLISMEIDTFDRLRSGLNSFHGELLWIRSLHKR